MIRVSGFLVIRQVAADAGRRPQDVVVIHMAVGALARRHRVCVGKRKSHQVVIELCVQPGVGRVAILTGDGEQSGNVVGSGRVPEIRLMA